MKKNRVPSPGQGRSSAPSGGLQVSQDHVHELGKNGSGD